MTATNAPADVPKRGNFYTRAWRALPRDLGYNALTWVLLASAYAFLYAIFWGGIGSIAFIVGIFLVIAALYGARWLGDLELVRLGWAGFSGIRPVRWGPGTGNSTFARFFSALGNPHYWLYLLHATVLLPIVGILSFVFIFTWAVVGLAFLFTPILVAIFGTAERFISNPAEAADFFNISTPAFLVLMAVIGAALLATLPLLTRAFTLLSYQIARLTLSGFRSSDLEQQVGDLDASRGAAISAEGHSLRRLERDIHDGPQQRLVRLQMDLSAAERQLDTDPAAARGLIAEAMEQSKEALEELRALSRGFAPPILLDRGLVAALESAAVRSSIPARVVNELPADGLLLPQEVERNAYFVASEALTNASRHSGATQVETRLGLRTGEDGQRWLDVTVSDNGRGGATSIEGRGIAGLEQRLHGFGGTLEVSSPQGGPTAIIARFPLAPEPATAASPVEPTA